MPNRSASSSAFAIVEENHLSTSVSIAALVCSRASRLSFFCSAVSGAGFARGGLRCRVPMTALMVVRGAMTEWNDYEYEEKTMEDDMSWTMGYGRENEPSRQ